MRKILLALSLLVATPAMAADYFLSPFNGVAGITLDTIVAPTRAVAAVCTVAGTVQFNFINNTTMPTPVIVGYNQFNFGLQRILSAGTTATCNYYRLQ